jgi:predicted MFS family arabinose efflux permease
MSEPAKPGHSQPIARFTRGDWVILLILVAVHFTHMVDFVIIMPLGDRLMKELKISPAQFGVIVSTYAIAAGVASLLASLAMDRFDRKSVLLTMYAGFGLSTLFCGLAPNYELLLLARTLAGVFGGLAAVAIMAVIGDVFPVEKRGRAMGGISSAFGVASVVGLPIGLFLAKWYGRGAPFIVLAALSAIVWVVGYLRMPQIRGHLEHPRSNVWSELKGVARNPDHVRAYLFTFFLVIGTFTVASFIAPYLMSINGWTEADLAMMYFAAGLCTLVAMNFVGYLADRAPRLLLFRVFGSLALVMCLVVTNLPSTPLYVALIVMCGFMVSATARFVPAQAMIIGVAEPRVRGAFMSLNSAVQHLATGVSPLIAGFLVGESEDGRLIGFPVVGYVAAGAALVSLILGGLLRSAPTPRPVHVDVEAKPTANAEAIVEPAVA